MRHKLTAHASKVVRSVIPPQLRGNKAIKRMVSDFAERFNMVYFGYVNQLSDEHRIVRGLTVSTQHRDDHYCIGTFKHYDVVFVERTDTLLTSTHTHTWHIMEFDLKSTADIPHLFIGSSRHGLGFHSLLKAKYSSMLPVQLGMTGRYTDDFTHYFNMYVAPAEAIAAEQIVTPEVATMIATHFKGLVIEITADALYVYSEKSHLSPQLLDVMLINGAWLADMIDQKSQLV